MLGAILSGTMAGGWVGGSGPLQAGSPATGSPATINGFALVVKNLDGPISNVLIGDRKVGTLNCWDATLTLTPGDSGLPPLPWSVTIIDISRSPHLAILGTRLESGNADAETMLIRVHRVEIRPGLTPADVNPSCSPAPAGEILY